MGGKYEYVETRDSWLNKKRWLCVTSYKLHCTTFVTRKQSFESRFLFLIGIQGHNVCFVWLNNIDNIETDCEIPWLAENVDQKQIVHIYQSHALYTVHSFKYVRK